MQNSRSKRSPRIGTPRQTGHENPRPGAVAKHVADISQKYLIPGEAQETAFMFVPSESIYAELHDGFDDLVQKAYRARVVVVSPAILMLAIQVMQQIQRDARMREAADQIRDKVARLAKDVGLR